MAKIRQLKESLLGWGGYRDLQDKIYLDKQVVYAKKYISQSTKLITDKFYRWVNDSDPTDFVYTKVRTPILGTYAYTAQGANHSGSYIETYDETTDKCTMVGDSNIFYTFDQIVENQTVYTIVTTEKWYPINFDKTQSDKAFLVEFSDDNNAGNAEYFFDKRTQCIIRTAYSEYGGTFDSTGNFENCIKHIVFSAYDPNTCALLDHHERWGYSSKPLANDSRTKTSKINNCSQGYYSMYCDGLKSPPTTTSTSQQIYPFEGEIHRATLFMYSPRHKKVFDIELGLGINTDQFVGTVQNPIQNTYGSYTIDSIFSVYNESEDLDKLDQLTVEMSLPAFVNNTYGNTKPIYSWKLYINLETNPYTITGSLIDDILTDGAFYHNTENYPNYPFTTNVVLYTSASNDMLKIARIYNKISTGSESEVQESVLGYDNESVERYIGSYGFNTHRPRMSGMCGNVMYPSISLPLSTGFQGKYIHTYLSPASLNNHVVVPNYYKTFDYLDYSSYSGIEATRAPQMEQFPKRIIPKAKRITSAGPVVTIGSTTYTKSYDDECFGYIIASGTYNSVLIFSKTQNGALGYNTNDTIPKVVRVVLYKGETYYIGLYENNYEGSQYVVNTMDLPYLHTTDPISKVNDWKTIQAVATLALDAHYGEGYEAPLLLLDYYHANQYPKLNYHYYYFEQGNDFDIYDGASKYPQETRQKMFYCWKNNGSSEYTESENPVVGDVIYRYDEIEYVMEFSGWVSSVIDSTTITEGPGTPLTLVRDSTGDMINYPYVELGLTNSILNSTSEKHCVITCAGTGAAPKNTTETSYAKYINLISVVEKIEENGQGGERSLLDYHTDVLDCHTNSVYAADNVPLSQTITGRNGAFNLPPFVIADGDLTSDVVENPPIYYAWKLVENNETTVIFTKSLDAVEVVGTTYFYKDYSNNFYKESSINTNAVITSLTPTYLTLTNGKVYNRIMNYDWMLEVQSQTYVPRTMVGWAA